ncbi:MAG: radical SAM family heme chaperone HemW [Ignavibacteriales bacterium]|nr:radical SAM family heme chaperone HemW [Ignavibacteriales bacterium]
MKNTAIYIHIPFCDHKCIYCDFYSLINYDNLKEYLDALKREIIYYADRYSKDRIIDTIFFGGGTPSFMTPNYIGEIISTINKNFILSNYAEITLETNPGTVEITKLKDFRNAGVNRISIGIQTFDEDELKFLTRIHNKKTAIDTVNNSFDAGFENISIDLIFSLPNQTKETWEENLEIAAGLPIKHISAYSLILEKGTILNKMVLDGKVKMAEENHDAELYEITMKYLTVKGFNQYEISNFAHPGFECKHNQYYWEYKDYLGFGTAAHSFVNGVRWWNYSSLKKYIHEINLNQTAIRGKENLTQDEMFEEFVMLGLRSKGINLDEINKYSPTWYFEKKKIINSFIEQRYLVEKNNYLSCTQKGYMICDEIINNLL